MEGIILSCRFQQNIPEQQVHKDKVRPFSIPNNIYFFFENKRSNLSILASQSELAGTLLISQMPLGEGVLLRENVPGVRRNHRE